MTSLAAVGCGCLDSSTALHSHLGLAQAAHLRFTFRKRHNIDSVIGGSPIISVEWRRIIAYSLNDT